MEQKRTYISGQRVKRRVKKEKMETDRNKRKTWKQEKTEKWGRHLKIIYSEKEYEPRWDLETEKARDKAYARGRNKIHRFNMSNKINLAFEGIEVNFVYRDLLNSNHMANCFWRWPVGDHLEASEEVVLCTNLLTKLWLPKKFYHLIQLKLANNLCCLAFCGSY